MEKKIKQNNFKTAVRLMKYISGAYKLQFFFVIITIIISSLANMAGPLFLMYLIDDIIAPLALQQIPDFTNLWLAVAAMAGFYLVGILCTYIYNRLMVNIGQGVQKNIRNEMFIKMQKLPINFFDTHSHGEVMSVYTNDIDTLRQLISQSIPQLFACLITVATMFCVMVAISWQLSILAVVMVLIMIFVTRFLGGKSSKHFINQQNDLSAVNGYIEEMMSGQKVVKVFNRENKTEERFIELNKKLCVSSTKANKYGNVVMPCINNIGNFQFVLTAILGGAALIGGWWVISIGQLVSFLQFTRSFNQPFSQISQQFSSMAMALAGARRIFSLMDETVETDDGFVTLANVKLNENGELVETSSRSKIWAWKKTDSNGTISYKEVKGNIELNNISFGYSSNKTILSNITVKAGSGQKVAFVGSTGAGKTTITNLLNRFYEINEGEILYDGINIKNIKKSDLRKSLGIVLQDTNLFSGSVMDNIRYGRLNATDEEVFSAAKLANAHDFILRLPSGYLTQLSGNGEELSQGQKQLLAIARAALANSPVLILDEATSSIDTRTEILVQDGMDKLMSGRTVFVIAHRLSTIRNSDIIEVLEKGKIIEEGNHKKLILNKGTYYRLYTGDLELA